MFFPFLGRVCFLFSLFFNLLQASSLSLQEAEELALKNNPLYLATEKTQGVAKQRKWQAFSSYMPQIRYNSFYAYTPKNTAIEIVKTGEIGFAKHLSMHQLALDQTILSSDKAIDYRVKKLEEKGAYFFSDQIRKELLLKVRFSYYASVLGKLFIEAQKETIGYLQAALKIEEEKLKLGNSTSFEVNQNKVALEGAISEYYERVKDLQAARGELVKALGIKPEEEKTLFLQEETFPLESIPLIFEKIKKIEAERNKDLFLPLCNTQKLLFFSEEEVHSFLATALKKRPELKLKEIEIAKAEQNVSRSLGNYLPDVSGFADYTKNGGNPASRTFSRDSFSWAFGIKLSWNVFDSFIRESKVKESRYKKDTTLLKYRSILDEVEIQIRNQLFQIENSLLSVFSSKEGLSLAKQALDQAKEKLQFGKISPLEYRQAVVQFVNAFYAKNRASFSLLMAYYQLVYQTGES